MIMKQLPNYERPRTPPPTSYGPSLPHRPGPEWLTPTIARVRQMKEDDKSASDIQKALSVPPRTQRKMLAKNLHSDRRPDRSNRGRPLKIDLETVHKMQRYIQGRYNKRTLN